MCRDLVANKVVFDIALIQLERDGLVKLRYSADGQKSVKFVSESADINNELDRVESEILKYSFFFTD